MLRVSNPIRSMGKGPDVARAIFPFGQHPEGDMGIIGRPVELEGECLASTSACDRDSQPILHNLKFGWGGNVAHIAVGHCKPTFPTPPVASAELTYVKGTDPLQILKTPLGAAKVSGNSGGLGQRFGAHSVPGGPP